MRFVVLAYVLLGACSDDRRALDSGPVIDATQVDVTNADTPVSGFSGQIGEACARDEDCTEIPGLTCYLSVGGGALPTLTFPGGYCSKACGSTTEPGEAPPQDECGARAGCTTSSMSGGGGAASLSICAPPCSMDSECRQAEGYRCNIIFGTFGSCGLAP